MMDPVAALGLAGNIVQFVDFSCKILHDSKILYGSSTGASADSDVIKSIASDIVDLDNALTAPSEPGAIPDSVRSLASACKTVAAELLKVLEKIRVEGPNRRWKSFVQALRSVLKKEQIEELVKRMERLRGETQYRLQLMLSEGQSELRVMLASIIVENRKLKLDGAQQLESLIKGVHDAISQLQAETTARNKIAEEKPQVDQILRSGDAMGPTPFWEDMKGLSDNIYNLANKVRSSASDNILINSLWFEYIPRRQAAIERAHERTFGWVLDPSSPVDFDDWLQSRNGIYWIRGKAGSGKSTLMNFLLNHTRTAESLKSWAEPKQLVIASFFFCNAGPSLQKSQEGLFRSLLYEILRQCPNLTRTVCASKAKTIRPFSGSPEPWTRQELWHAIGQLKDQNGVRARFCFFIDGLDEYDGDPDIIVNVLESLRGWLDVKLCVSSRPYNEFIDAFGRPSDPHLALEDLTREDIRLYVRDTLEDNSRFRALKARDNRSQHIVDEIVDKARGVFLWIRLVVRSLLKGLSNADRISDLQKRLRDFPDTLEKYFRNMIDSVDSIYREQTAQAFEYALEAEQPLSLMTYSFLDEEDLDAVVAAPLNFITEQEISSRQDDMKRRLNGRCKGLLEVVEVEIVIRGEGLSPNRYTNLFHAPKVEFHHRTVRDFLQTKDMQKMLAENLRPGFEPKLLFCKALLAQMKALDCHALGGSKWLMTDLLEDLAYYASRLEDETRVPQSSLLDEVGRCFIQQARILTGKGDEKEFLMFIAQRGLDLYITERLTGKTPMTQSDKSSLLGSVLDATNTKYQVENSKVRIIDILLENGAQPNSKYKQTTVWGHFLLYYNANHTTTIRIIQSLLSHGANLQQRIVTGQKTQRRNMSGRASDLYKREEFQVDVVKSAEQLLLDRFGRQKVSEMLEKARDHQKSTPSTSKWWLGQPLRKFMKHPKRWE